MHDSSSLQQLKRLAESESTYKAVLQDEACLHGLVLLLSNSDTEIVCLSLQILIILSNKHSGCCLLRELPCLKEQLEFLARSGAPKEGSGTLNAISDFSKTLLSKLYDRSTCGGATVAHSSVSPSIRPQNIVLRLYGVHNETELEDVRERILKVRGVISITFQPHKGRAIVCTIPSLDPARVIQALHEPKENVDPNRQFTSISNPGVTGRIVRKRSTLHHTKPSMRLKRDESVRIGELPEYLDENADLFEVDETRAAPKLKSPPDTSKTDANGPIAWLSDFFERSFFW